MDVTNEQMTRAQGFDENNWPNFFNANFISEPHRRYKVETHGNRDRNLDTNIDKNGTNVNVDGATK
jgi:hypothetical protein